MELETLTARARSERGQRAAVDRARRVSYVLDEAFRVPGTNYRVGVDPVLSILPVVGDAAGLIVSLYVIYEGYRAGVSLPGLAVMGLLVLVDAVAGSVPLLGTVFDAVWKANEWNVRIIERSVDPV